MSILWSNRFIWLRRDNADVVAEFCGAMGSRVLFARNDGSRTFPHMCNHLQYRRRQAKPSSRCRLKDRSVSKPEAKTSGFLFLGTTGYFARTLSAIGL